MKSRVLSVKGILVKEALVAIANLSQLMAIKMDNPFCMCKAGLTVGL